MESVDLDEKRFLGLMEAVIGESKYVQNQPPKLVPEEDRIIGHVLKALEPYNKDNGGVLEIKKINFKENRGNLFIEYKPPNAVGTCAFMGSHMDVVPANPEKWTVDPFKLTVDGDKLYGRGTTDCLGHVAMLTEYLIQIGQTKPDLKVALSFLFIASEENASIPEVGVDMVMKHGYLDHLSKGPVFWIDCADSEPCMGTAAAIQWKLECKGHLFHSGLPHNGINALEFAMEVCNEMQKRFYKDFPPHEKEERYQFASPSTMKPTCVEGTTNAVNQVPPVIRIEGDIRLTPFYNADECVKKVMGYAEDINKTLDLPTRGPCSKYSITKEDGTEIRGTVDFKIDNDIFKGLAANLDSPGFEALDNAVKKIRGSSKPYSITGSLPLVGDMQEAGFDVQLIGFGKSSVYHGDDEYCSMSEMKDAIKIINEVAKTISDKQ